MCDLFFLIFWNSACNSKKNLTQPCHCYLDSNGQPLFVSLLGACISLTEGQENSSNGLTGAEIILTDKNVLSINSKLNIVGLLFGFTLRSPGDFLHSGHFESYVKVNLLHDGICIFVIYRVLSTLACCFFG